MPASLRRHAEAQPRSLRWMLALLLVAFGGAATAVDGTVDPAFGRWTILVGDEFGRVEGLVVQPDGRSIVVSGIGTSLTGCQRTSTSIARLNASGSPDRSFGDSATPGRTVLLGFCDESLLMRAVAVQDDGRIVLAGERKFLSTGAVHAVVIRLAASGAIDTSFGTAGLATLRRNASASRRDSVYSLALRPGAIGGILVAGSARDPGTGVEDAAAWVLDGFGIPVYTGNHVEPDGLRYWRHRVLRPFSTCRANLDDLDTVAGDAFAYVVMVASCSGDGESVSRAAFLGRIALDSNAPMLVRAIALDPADVLDANGFLPVNHSYADLRVAVDASRRVWASGRASSAQGFGTVLGAFSADLADDLGSLGGGARVRLPPFRDFEARDFVLQADGKPIIVGNADGLPGQRSMAAIRVAPETGMPDLTFGPVFGGAAVVDFAQGSSFAFRVALDPAGRGVVLAGNVNALQGGDLVGVTRLLVSAPGTPFADGFE